MKIVIAGVMYSPNLGDGLIAECLSASIKAVQPDASITWLDLAGRSGFVKPSRGLRTLVLGALAKLPNRVSQPISSTLVQRQIARHLAPGVPSILEGADLVIIGGGQLFGDANLNFPLKLAYIVRAAESAGVPIAIHGVGVSKSWTTQGIRMFAQTLTSSNLRFISVRDDASAQNLVRHYQDMAIIPPCPIAVYPDPGLCTGMISVKPTQNGSKRRKIGIGIVHPAALATHSMTADTPSKAQACHDYVKLAEALHSAGVDIHLFTNGAGEDVDMLAAVARKVGHVPSVTIEPRFSTPQDLVNFIASTDALVSHRLHACIAANALGKTAIGVTWDKKIDAYFALTEQEHNLFTSLSDRQAVSRALLTDLSPQVHSTLRSLKPMVADGVRAVLSTVQVPVHASIVA